MTRPRWTQVAATAGAALVAVMPAGCGGQTNRPAVHVAAYLRQVNRIEAGLTGPFTTVSAAGTRLARANSTTGTASAQRAAQRQARVLRGAERRIAEVGSELAQLPAPAPARNLKALLVALVHSQTQLTEQTARLVAFLPAFSRDLRPLAPATLRLERALAVNQAYGASAVQAVYARKAQALRVFAGSADGVMRGLRALQPPRVSGPELRAQLASLSGMRAASLGLAGALAAGRTSGLTGLLNRFDRAAAANGTAAVRRAQTAAIKGYDGQLNRLSQLTAQVQRERQRLAGSLG